MIDMRLIDVVSEQSKVKYCVPDSQKEESVLSNLLNLKSDDEINKAEFEGFLRSERIMTETLSTHTVFNNHYIQMIHKYALYQLYSFAGQYRSVNITKEGFFFPPAKYIVENMNVFEKNILSKNVDKQNKDSVIENIALVHAELLFIHPFREGNGRTARILANMMAYKAGFNRLKFEELIKPDKFRNYVLAVQNAGIGKYDTMTQVIQEIF